MKSYPRIKGAGGPPRIMHGALALEKEIDTRPLEINGLRYETYRPADDETDPRLFERCIETGRIVQTMD